MKKIRILIAIVFALAVITFTSVMTYAQLDGNDPWPRVYQNNQNTARSPKITLNNSPHPRQWSWFFGGHSPSSPIVALEPGSNTKLRIYVLGDDCSGFPSLFAIDPSTGQPVWTYNLSVTPVNTTPAVDANNTIYVPGFGGVEAVHDLGNSASFAGLYSNSDNFQESSPAIGTDGVVYIGQSLQSSDRLRFHFIGVGVHEHTNIPANSACDYLTPAVSDYGQIFVVGSYENTGGVVSWVERIDGINSCEEITSREEESKSGLRYVGAPVISSQGKVYVALKPGRVKCCYGAFWEETVPPLDEGFTLALGVDSDQSEFLVVGSITGFVTKIGLNADGSRNPTKSWSVPVASGPVGRSPSIDKSGVICVVDESIVSPKMHFLRANDGGQAAPSEQLLSPTMSTPVIAAASQIINGNPDEAAIFVLNSAGLHMYANSPTNARDGDACGGGGGPGGP